MTSTAVLHEVVQGVLADIQGVDGGPGLSDGDLRKWVRAVSGHPDRAAIGKQLIAVARQLHGKKAGQAASQLVVLATYAVGPEATSSTLDAAGFRASTQRELIESSQTISRGLAFFDDDPTVVDPSADDAS